jgi:DNA-binding NarL/FixJ family response regulator
MQGHMGRQRILLADDAQEVIDRVYRSLGSDFEIVGVARNGEQAVQFAQTLRADVLILDISMPMLTGIQVASQLHQFDGNPKIVFLTCHEDSDYIDAAFSVGALGYVFKSRMAHDLVPAIEAALRGDKFMSQVQVHPLPTS